MMDCPPTPAAPLDHGATRDILNGFARLHSLVVVSDPDCRVLWMSEALADACDDGRPLQGRSLCDVFASLSGSLGQRNRLAEQLAQLHARVRRHDRVADFRLDLGTSASKTPFVELSAFELTLPPEGRADASPAPLVVTIVHPPESERGERAAETGEAILAASPDAVLAIGPAGFVEYANPGAAALFGAARQDLVGRPLALFLSHAPHLLERISDLRASGELDDERVEFQANGRRRWLSLSTRTRTGAGEQPAGHLLYMRDVSDSAAALAEIERKNAALESYVHSVSHDLRSPLVSLLGFTRLLRQDYDAVLGETGRHFADRIEQAGRTMESLIEDLLELSRIGASNEQRTLVDPRAVLQQLRAELKLRLDEAGADIEIPENPPLLLCDRTRLYQLFSNLVGNALDHMGPCDDRRIRIAFDTQPDRHVITVADRGRGVPARDHERIFEVFQTSARANSGGRSTGVGLAIVKKIAEIHGGRAWVESAPGEGARFHVSLPRG